MTNKNNTTLYTGVTSNLYQRVLQHKDKYYSAKLYLKIQSPETRLLGSLSGNWRCYLQGKTNKSRFKTKKIKSD
ncbi:GIY-YIG nuclease family protein [Chryseobacterium tongliaoense]|uniref:GIY-YIG nuclease family protein n=1 Tax=Chryseobacterium tongliaoense TaxID=3240933 RepID=UPI0035171601